MGIYKYMFNSGNQEEILNYCNETLRKLEEYDHANGTALQETLLSYYINGFNAGKTAEALFIHRNSLQYRMNKIEELLEIGLDDYMESVSYTHLDVYKRQVMDTLSTTRTVKFFALLCCEIGVVILTTPEAVSKSGNFAGIF